MDGPGTLLIFEMFLQFVDTELWQVLERCYLKNAVQELGMFLIHLFLVFTVIYLVFTEVLVVHT